MIRYSAALLFVFLVITPLCAQRALEPSAWVADFRKAGGRATLVETDDGEKLISIERRGGQKPSVGLRDRPVPTGITSVGLQGFGIDDGDLAALAGWKQLRKVKIVDGKGVTDKGVLNVARILKLVEVELIDTSVTGTGLKEFSKHPALVHLVVINTNHASRAESLELSEMNKLETLTLAVEGVSRISLTKLPRLRQVSDFPSSLTRLELSDLGPIEELDLGRTRLTEVSLSGLPKLEGIDLRDTKLSQKQIDRIRTAFPTAKIRN